MAHGTKRSVPRRPAQHRAAHIRWAVGTALLLGLAGQGVPAVELPDWQSLRAYVLELEIQRADAVETTPAVGFVLEEAGGIVTCYRLVRGAERIAARRADGSRVAITRYLACDPERDLVVLEVPEAGGGLASGDVDRVALRQVVFGIQAPAAPQPGQPLRYYSSFTGDGIESLLAIDLGAPTGTPLADSLGHVFGIVEILRDGPTTTACAIPIGEVEALLTRPDPGGPLADLPRVEPAAWTDPTRPAGAQVMGAALARRHAFAKAMPYLDRALAESPPAVPLLLEYGMAWQAQGEHRDAEAKYREALDQDPDCAATYLYLGSCLHMQGRYLKAQETYEAGLARMPEVARLHSNLGGIYFLQQRKSEAERAFRQALSLNPNLGVAKYNLGVLLINLGRMGEARTILDELHAVGSGHATQMERFLHGS